jgi:predicted DNA-binding helix-hairpin-helix protein
VELLDKLTILADAAKYDAACTSSGLDRAGRPGGLGSTLAAGCCHSFSADGRCISLLKVLLTNRCVYDCAYCVNRRSSDVRRAAFTPRELAELTFTGATTSRDSSSPPPCGAAPTAPPRP